MVTLLRSRLVHKFSSLKFTLSTHTCAHDPKRQLETGLWCGNTLGNDFPFCVGLPGEPTHLIAKISFKQKQIFNNPAGSVVANRLDYHVADHGFSARPGCYALTPALPGKLEKHYT